MKKLFTLLFILILSLLTIPSAQADPGSLYLSPSTGTYTVGSTFSIVVKVNTSEVAINAAEGSLVFDPDILEVTALSKAGSIFSLWTTEPVFSNSSGSINFGGGLPDPGYTGASGTIITITFKAKRAAAAQVNFSSGAVLANDGKGTNILTSMGGGNYTLAPETVTPEPEPTPTPTPTPLPPTPGQVPEAPVIIGHPTKWRAENSFTLKWELPSDVNGVSIRLDKEPKSDPGPLSDGLFTEKSYEDLEDGIWYFHIKFRNRYGWGSTIHHKVLIDTIPPEPFEITVDNEGDPTSPTPILHFTSIDKTSGIEYYEVKIGEGDALPVTVADIEQNPFEMPPQAPGKHTTIVEAVDKAGNFTIAAKEVIIEPVESPVISRLPEKLRPGDILSFGGKTFPDSTVIVFTQIEGEEPTRIEVKTDSEGNWAYIHPRTAEKGIYRIWTEVKDSRGALSLPSQKITLAVELPSLFKIGDIVIDYLTIMITLIALIIFIILVVLYGWTRIVRARRRLKKEVGEAEETLREAFDGLREKVEKIVSGFDSRRGLSDKERKVRDKLNEALEIAQKFIGKEIKDVGKEVE